MNSLVFMRHRTPSEAGGVPDVDVTPVMNMFIILIPFLVSMAVFTHVSILEFSLPPNVGAQLDAKEGKPRLKPTIVIKEEFLAVTLGESMLDSIALRGGRHDVDSLRRALRMRRPSFDIANEAIVAAGDRINVETIVAVMDACRAEGFAKLGLSEASGGEP